MNTPYYLTAESRAFLAARAAEIRDQLRRRREARDSVQVRQIVAAATRICQTFETPFIIGGQRVTQL